MASNTPFQGFFCCGFLKRAEPVGGSAKGTPRNARTGPAVVGTSTPLRRPVLVETFKSESPWQMTPDKARKTSGHAADRIF